MRLFLAALLLCFLADETFGGLELGKIIHYFANTSAMNNSICIKIERLNDSQVFIFASDWRKVTDEVECGGSEKSMGTVNTLLDCADACREISSMFIYGTNDFGEIKCKTNGKEDCPCYCETSSKNGNCKWVDNSGYILYKYIGRKKGKGNKID